MSYIGNQSGRIVYTNLNKFKGTVADLTALAAVTGASSGDMYKVEDSGHAHMYDGTQWVDMGLIVGPQGVKGTGITSVVRTSGDGSEGTVDTYTITYDDTSTSTFEVRNGTAGTINHIAKTGTVGTTDTYTAYADAAKTQLLGSFEVYNGVDGKAITSITFTSTTDVSGLPAQSGGTDTYTISYSDATTSTYDVYNGADITNVSVIDDTQASASTTYSSTKIQQEIAEFTSSEIDDTAVSTEATWSSEKINEELDTKVDKAPGKGLSTEDFTTAEKTKLADIESGAQVNVATDLGYTASNRVLTSSTGTNVTLPQVTTVLDGLMLSVDKSKLDSIEANAKDDQTASEVPVTPSGNLVADNVQSALQELQSGIDSFTTSIEW